MIKEIRAEALQRIRERIKCTDYLTKSKNGFYCCPFCGSGTGPNKTGALKYNEDDKRFKCFSCGKSGDVIDLYRNETGADYNTALSLLAEKAGYNIEAKLAEHRGSQASKKENKKQEDKTPMEERKPAEAPKINAEEKPEIDHSKYYKECRERIYAPEAVAYLNSRGISAETAYKYFIGYDPEADPAESGYKSPRIIVPTSKEQYIGRSIDANEKKYAKMNSKGAAPGIFNYKNAFLENAENCNKPASNVFVTEGFFDALSLLEYGATAISLNSANNAEILLKKLEQEPTEATLILCLDNDDAGQRATEELRQGLQRLNISYIIENVAGKYKDANEALKADPAAFQKNIIDAIDRAGGRPDNTTDYLDTLFSEDVSKFKKEISTGFRELDKKAGGLYPGLYGIAAISSLGKTSFSLQLADQLAELGNDVILFSLEQSKLELVSKSLARIIAGEDPFTNITSLDVRKGKYTQEVQKAISIYKENVGKRVSIIEGNFNCNISFIGSYLRDYIKRTGEKPIIFIDYLQILQPAEDKKQTDKEKMDNIVTELKRLSRELDLTIFVISSVNRVNYLTPIDFESIKESGNIEFTCDVIWGLQLQCLNSELFDKPNAIKEKREEIRKAKAETPRKVELVCLKNRYGISNFSVYFDYFPANDLFKEGRPPEDPQPAGRKAGRKL